MYQGPGEAEVEPGVIGGRPGPEDGDTYTKNTWINLGSRQVGLRLPVPVAREKEESVKIYIRKHHGQ